MQVRVALPVRASSLSPTHQIQHRHFLGERRLREDICYSSHCADALSRENNVGVARLVRLVADKGNDHAVQVEEEHQQVETQLDEGFLHRVSM
jgi:hypothetical protein